MSSNQRSITSFFSKRPISTGSSKENADLSTKMSAVEKPSEPKRLKRVIEDDEKKVVAKGPPANQGLPSPTNVLPYKVLSKAFEEIEQVTGRLEIQKILTSFFMHTMEGYPQDLLPAVYLCVCTNLAPPFQGVQIGIGDSLLIKAIAETTGKKTQVVKSLYEKEGDLGLVAQKSRSSQQTLGFIKPKELTVAHVYQSFLKIAETKGNKSQDRKVAIIKSLLVASKEQDTKYIIRGLQGKLRIGLAEKTILISLAHAFNPDHKDDAVMWIKRAFSECPSYDHLIPVLLEHGLTQDIKKHCHLLPGIPVSPMLARPTKSYAMVYERFVNRPFTCEYKYDGERAQIHVETTTEGKKRIRIFSRNFEESTERFPDVIQQVLEAIETCDITNAIIDTEVVAIDPEKNVRLPFQVLSTRSRKNVELESIKVKVCTYAFDLLYLNDKSYLTEPLTTRREALRSHFKSVKGNFEMATYLDVSNPATSTNEEAMEEQVQIIRDFLTEAVQQNCEGLMVKTLEKEATYEPANRSHKWLKLKKDYLEGIGDSVDLVPIGAFHGKGKRTGVYGAYLLACHDPETDMFQAITKLGTGLNDEALTQFHQQLQQQIRPNPRNDYAICANGIQPDVWFEPSVVWEILGADLSISPKYTASAGLVHKEKGISLRFPRFVRIREDKKPAEATTSSQIADLYRAQGLAENPDEALPDEEDDDYL